MLALAQAHYDTLGQKGTWLQADVCDFDLDQACDLALASDQAKFCTPGVNIGSFCTTPLVGIGRNMHRKHALVWRPTSPGRNLYQVLAERIRRLTRQHDLA